jgi:hypothetical protein
MQIELENLVWDRKELQEHLQTAMKEGKMMELILAELEEEYDKAIAKIEQLEGEVLILYCRIFLRNFTCWFQWLFSVDVRGRSKV